MLAASLGGCQTVSDITGSLSTKADPGPIADPQRIAAVHELPRAQAQGPAAALSLFDNAEEIEKELTDFLTGYIHYMQQLQAQVEALKAKPPDPPK